jgi:hypothetical protein
MDESESKKENLNNEKRQFDPDSLKRGLYCDPKQYQFLKDCSKEGPEGIKKWNEWRSKKENRHKDIYLEGAPLDECYLKNIDLALKGVEYEGEWSGRKGTSEVFLREANLRWANLKSAALMGTHLEGAKIWFAHLEDADVSDAHLESTECRRATVDSTTSLWKCKVDRKTDFLGVSLDAAKIDPGTKQLLKYNIRRKNWEEWYKEHCLLRWPVRWFWCLSDYGISTWRVIIWFLVLSLLFATIYANCAYWWPIGIVSNLAVEPHLPIWHYFLLLLLRPIYFSIVTMTTLGFGDMYANAQSICGHILLSLQVILGYVLLGALVTRFAVLFTAGGPAGKFAKEN